MLSRQIFALIVFGLSITGTVSDDPNHKRVVQPVYQQNIIINPLDELLDNEAPCNHSKIQDIISNELQNTTRRLVQLESNIASKVDAVSAELNDVKLQVDQIKETVSELAELLKNRTGGFGFSKSNLEVISNQVLSKLFSKEL